MSNYSEEEQIQALKNFWDDYGTAIMVGIAVALAVFAGWRYWSNQQKSNQQQAATQYQQVIEQYQKSMESAAGAENTNFQRAARKLMEEHGDMAYGQFAALLVAKRAVESNDLKEAEKQLRWVLEQKPDEGLRIVTSIRLARVLFGQGDNAAAMAILDKESNPEFVATVQELRGDILVADKKPEEAAKAYQKASEVLASKKESRPLLEIKMADLGLKPVKVDAPKNGTENP